MAAAGGNHAEAHTYYTKILEADTTHFAAWLGKGESAGRLSTLQEFRLQETIASFRTAIALVPQEEEATLRLKAATVVAASIDYFAACRQHISP